MENFDELLGCRERFMFGCLLGQFKLMAEGTWEPTEKYVNYLEMVSHTHKNVKFNCAWKNNAMVLIFNQS